MILMILVWYVKILRVCFPQADSLYMGVPTGIVSCLLWLLFLQRHVVGSPVAPPVLGCSHIKNGLQVYLYPGGFTDVSVSMHVGCVGMWGMFYFCLCCLSSLLIFIPQLEGDDRSDKEEDDSDPPIERNHKPSHMNGSGARGRANGHWNIQRETEKDVQQICGHFSSSLWITTVRV